MSKYNSQSVEDLEASYQEIWDREGLDPRDAQELFDLGMEIESRKRAADKKGDKA